MDGKLNDLTVCGHESLVRYDPERKTASFNEWRHPEWAAHTLFTRSSERHSFGIFGLTTDAQSGVSVREFRETSMWGGTRDIVEIEQPRTIIQGRPGETIGKWRREFDPTTGRLLSERSYRKEGDSWVLSSWTEEVDWDAEIPEETWNFSPPAGTKVRINDSWWSQHPGDPIGTERTNDYELTLYSIDRDRTGGLYLAVEPRSLQSGKGVNYPCPRVTDQAGVVHYVHDPHSYGGIGDGIWLMRLRPEPDAPPLEDGQDITITFNLAGCCEEWKDDTTVTFCLPLPPPRDDDLSATHEVQY